MDSLNFSSPFNTPVLNIDNWGNVTNNLGNSFGYVDRFSNFQSNLSPYSYKVDNFGTVNIGLGSPVCKLSGYNDYRSNLMRRDSLDYLQLKESREGYSKPYESPWDKLTYKLPEIEPKIYNFPKKEYNYNLPSLEQPYYMSSSIKKNSYNDILPNRNW